MRLHLQQGDTGPGAVRPAADAHAPPEHRKPRQITRPIRSSPTPSSYQTDKTDPTGADGKPHAYSFRLRRRRATKAALPP